MTAVDIVVVGQVARDLVLEVPDVPGPGSAARVSRRKEMLGGKGANIAVAAAQLGGRVSLVGVVGDDPTGEWLIRCAAADGLDTSHLVRRPGTASGLIVDVVTPDAEWRYLQDLPDEVLVTEADVNAAGSTMDDAGWVVVQLQLPPPTVLHAVARARAAGCRVVLDGVPPDEHRDRVLSAATVVRADQHEAEELTGCRLNSVADAVRAGRDLLRRGPSLVALATQDANVFVWGEDELAIPLGDAVVRDTTGGGDSFIAALTMALNRGCTPTQAAHEAVAASASTVSRSGGRPSLGSRGDRPEQ
jgi:ribokinase